MLLLLGLALAGCGRDGIQVYRIPKESPQPAAPAAAGGAIEPASSSPLKWKLPAGWEETPPSQMRVASFRVKGEGGKQAEVGVVPLSGMAGSDLDNVNRWRSQVGQPPIDQEEMAKQAEPVVVDGQSGQLYDQAGSDPASGGRSRILAVILRKEGMTWFFKMSGDQELVGGQKPAFIEFLKTVSFVAPAGQPATR